MTEKNKESENFDLFSPKQEKRPFFDFKYDRKREKEELKVVLLIVLFIVVFILISYSDTAYEIISLDGGINIHLLYFFLFLFILLYGWHSSRLKK